MKAYIVVGVVLFLMLVLTTSPAFATTVSPPSHVTASPIDAGDMLIKWTNPVGNVTDNHVYQYEAGCSILLVMYNTNGAVNTLTAYGLSANTTYCFTVTALVGGTESLPSAPASNTSLAAVPPPFEIHPPQPALSDTYLEVMVLFFICLSVMLSLIVINDRYFGLWQR